MNRREKDLKAAPDTHVPNMFEILAVQSKIEFISSVVQMLVTILCLSSN
jgi:hypothetical protein